MLLGKIRSVLGINVGKADQACILHLVQAYKKLESTNGHVVADTASAKETCQAFLKVLEKVCPMLKIKTVDRKYRDSFTTNYQALLPSSSRNYHVDILKAAIDQQQFLYVNGEKFDLGTDTFENSVRMAAAWMALGALLTRFKGDDQYYEDLCSHLAWLDCCWASFEHTYISELIEIEGRARSYIVKAVEQERSLAAVESNIKTEPEYFNLSNKDMEAQQRRCELVATISWLNSVANQRKGRDDLDSSILEEAIIQQKCCEQLDTSSAALLIAKDVTESFNEMRDYFVHISQVLERVDPSLCNNPGLVDRLAEWEGTWEVGRKYLCHKERLNSLNHIVAMLREVQEMEPAFRQMCEDSEPELFMCLPRLVWLCFLAEPSECGDFLKDILPHRFLVAPGQMAPNCSSTSEDALRLVDADAVAPFLPRPFVGDTVPESFAVDDEVMRLQARHRYVCQQLLHTQPAGSRRPKPHPRASNKVSVAWELLARRVVVGQEGAEVLYDLLLPHGPTGKVLESEVDGLIMELEGWSVELQRHCPQDWNRCSELLIHCLLSDPMDTQMRNPNDTPFRV